MNAPMMPPPPMPPHSLEAEQGLLGAILMHGSAVLDRIEGAVRPADFYRDDHRRIFAAAKAQHDAGKPVDVVTVADALTATGEAERTGGLTYLAELANASLSAANARRYAEIIRQRSTLRGLQQLATDLQSACAAGDSRDPAEIAAELEARMLKLIDRSESDPVRLHHAMLEVLQDVEDRRGRGGQIAGLATGFRRLDEMTGGFEPGQLVIVAARPGAGKTIAACNIAAHAAAAGTPTLFCTLEMTRREIAARILAARSHVSVQAMRAGTSNHDDWDQMSDAITASAAWPMFVDDRPAVTVPYIRAKARRIQRTEGLGLIVIDYLQLMRGTGDNRTQEVGSISRGLKALAKELRVPVIALAQINRASENRPDKRPTLADLRDSGEIEQDADIVLMLHRESQYRDAPEWRGKVELLLRKNRNGPTGDCLLEIDGALMRFTDYDGVSPRESGSAQNQPTRHKGFEA
ncbi:replicative DNA helicase [Thauera sp. Sel9]|uniref:replicative DNA helicase n=1 Tax=Thauera sp. Sel9 TaxID=2974299 RepID=UPI0021E1A06D|nr:replicative DNA helicase [Thauera sp. Sel9]MCV2218897.1 replicative DNA helicase [Thauera sp. Sel9]